MRMIQQRRLLGMTAAAASASTSSGWVSPTTVQSRHVLHHTNLPKPLILDSSSFSPSLRSQPTVSKTRLYSSSNKNEGFLSKIGNAAKSILGLQSDEEKKAAIQRKKVKDELTGNIDTFLKDAPLGVRMMGKMISPIVGNLASTLAESVAEQQKSVDAVLEEAQGYLISDPAVTDILGSPIRLGPPFSQSSSTSSINGKTTSFVELALPVEGSRGSGTVQVSSANGAINSLKVNAGGRFIDVNLTKTRSNFGSGKNSFQTPFNRAGADDNGIIEAEIIEKKTDK